MADARRAYQRTYTAEYQQQPQPERVRRTRQRPQVGRRTQQAQEEARRQQQDQSIFLNPANARVLIMAVVIIGALLIGMIVVNAQSAKLQYDINQLRSQNDLLENEIGTLNVMLERETSIAALEKYATEKLDMFYPEGSQCVHVSALDETEGSLAALIKEKAYS